MIYALNFTDHRDEALSNLMQMTLTKYCPNLGGVMVKKNKKYGNGAGWQACLIKIAALRDIVNKYKPTEGDYILSVDSDVVFCTSEVFGHVKDAGIIGIAGAPTERPMTPIGPLYNFSGCSIYIRGDVAIKMARMSPDMLNIIRAQLGMEGITQNEDIFLSYLAQFNDAEPKDLPPHLYAGDLEVDWPNPSSFYHLNYSPTMFMGRRVTGKWDIPRILQLKKIVL